MRDRSALAFCNVARSSSMRRTTRRWSRSSSTTRCKVQTVISNADRCERYTTHCGFAHGAIANPIQLRG
jgi:hypothetical protein